MSPSIADANDALRTAVQQRREAQAAGLPHEAWYTNEFTQAEIDAGRHRVAEADEICCVSPIETDAVQPVTETPFERHDIHEHHLHRAGLTQDELDEALERLAGDGIMHVQRPGSLPFLELLEELRQLHLSKSQDYGSESDPLANIRQGAEFVGIEAWRGCLVRVADKVQRLKTYCRTGRLVHEGVRDTLLDLAAYSLLAIVLFDEGRNG
jgi:hypothetical protein